MVDIAVTFGPENCFANDRSDHREFLYDVVKELIHKTEQGTHPKAFRGKPLFGVDYHELEVKIEGEAWTAAGMHERGEMVVDRTAVSRSWHRCTSSKARIFAQRAKNFPGHSSHCRLLWRLVSFLYGRWCAGKDREVEESVFAFPIYEARS